MYELCGSRSVMRERAYNHNGRRATKVRWLLVVEERALFREGLALLLEWHTGLSSVQAGSLAEAWRILSDTKGRPTCTIINLDLPDGDGIELLEQLNGFPVLALTGDRSLKRSIQALEAGADEVLPLAESAERIAGVVRRLVDG